MKKNIKSQQYVGMSSICNCRVRPNLRGLSKKEKIIAKKIYCDIPQYRHASRILAKEGFYCRSSPHNRGYKGMQPNHTAVYRWNNREKRLHLLFCCSSYRATQAMRAYDDFIQGKISPEVWNNYITDGYSTRRGLYADYSKSLDRMRDIARSHADYMGCETGDSSTDHHNRVNIRN